MNLLSLDIEKPTIIRICQSRMPLWIGLKLIRIQIIENRETTLEEWKEAVLSFPEDTNGCKCKACRYRRWFGG